MIKTGTAFVLKVVSPLILRPDKDFKFLLILIVYVTPGSAGSEASKLKWSVPYHLKTPLIAGSIVITDDVFSGSPRAVNAFTG